MEAETASVIKFIQAIGDARQALHGLRRRLWTRLDWRNVTPFGAFPSRVTLHHWDEDQQRGLVGANLGVSAELSDGSTIDWSLEVSCDAQGWLVERAIYRHDPDEDGSHIEVEFPEWQGITLEEMAAYLPSAVAELCDSIERPDLLLPRQQANAPA